MKNLYQGKKITKNKARIKKESFDGSIAEGYLDAMDKITVCSSKELFAPTGYENDLTQRALFCIIKEKRR